VKAKKELEERIKEEKKRQREIVSAILFVYLFFMILILQEKYLSSLKRKLK